MRMPSLRGIIDRRILVNFRIDADALTGVLPSPFEPRTVDGYAIGGICLLRLNRVRPTGLPAAVGVRSENAAHRIGIHWDDDGERRDGVFVPRRDTSSRLTALVADRSFGNHHHAEFTVDEGAGRYDVSVRSPDDVSMHVRAAVADSIPESSVFDSVDAASEYHRRGATGYSPSSDGQRFDGIELDTYEWSVTPLSVESVGASYFESSRFPADDVTFDNALLMEHIDHEWHSVEGICP
ncbi:DUF2071 domain-containing protein [Haloarcula sp. S1CR25-12]|uniref:DUF2071 domain-containing protein n=1 Tax=Haloarcula saliterrae TaxID=2950534 RepID=A0ABU2FGA0_9EURY|nr:DUF2071 domain-containing protein [Haloarcula sp. S1CR25-12]MDS0260836.1 DUF2071 domain-containing protein [Haloarcula sp. S1CR25-12]